MAVTVIAGRGGLAHSPGWTVVLEDVFLGKGLLSSPSPLVEIEVLLYKTWHSFHPISARAAFPLPVKLG